MLTKVIVFVFVKMYWSAEPQEWGWVKMSLQSCHWRFKNYMAEIIIQTIDFCSTNLSPKKNCNSDTMFWQLNWKERKLGSKNPAVQKEEIYIIWELEVTLVRLYQSCDISSSRSFAISHPSPDLICQSSATSQPNKVSPVKICWLLSFWNCPSIWWSHDLWPMPLFGHIELNIQPVTGKLAIQY